MTLENRKYTAPDTVRLPFRCAPGLSSTVAALTLLSGIVPTLQVLASAAFINTVITVVGGRATVSAVYPSIAAVVALIAWQWLSGELGKAAQVRLELKLRETLRVAITEKRARMLYRYVEDHDAWDLISRVAKEPETQVKGGYAELLNLASMLLQVAGLLALLLAHVWWAALAILAFSVPMVLLALKSGRATYDARRETSKFTRKYEYLSEVLAGRESVEERSLFGYGGRLNKQYQVEFDAACRIEVRTEARWFVKMKTGSVLFGLISILISMVLLQPALAGTISVGLFISLVTAVFSMVQMMSWGLTWSIDQLARHREYLKDLTGFAAFDELPGAELPPASPAPAFGSLVFRGVRFRYPGAEACVLDGLSLEIREGRHYAFVGVNGAGKTTITKLITGMYDNYEGEILLNGRNLRDYPQQELKSFFSVVFQDFARYSIPLGDNVALGDVNAMGGEGRPGVMPALEAIGMKEAVDGLALGVETPLGKISEGGQDLSGGQWQRVAMARTLISPAPVRILDEPTAAMDPLGESRLYEEFEAISRGRTTLFISHRLGSTKLADHIIVIGAGRVLEQGSHETLMAAGGEYAHMYESQRSWYQ